MHNKKKISTLKFQAADLENQGFKEIKKIDGLKQYGRCRNLEIAGVPQQLNENTNSIVIEVIKLLNVVVPSDHISTSHRLPKKLNHNTKDSVCPPSIIVRFTNRDTRNKMFANRKFILNLNLEQFSVPDPNSQEIFLADQAKSKEGKMEILLDCNR